jgi:hypothetical protein
MASAKSTFSELPTWAKGTIAVIGVLSLVGIGLWIRKGIKNRSENAEERQEDKNLEQNTQQALNQLQGQGISPTLSDLDAQTLSTTIQTLLDDCELSGSENLVVKSILEKVNNQADWVKLQQVFGRRTIGNCGWGETNYDLKGLLTDQLDKIDWNWDLFITKLKKGLTSKGITF